MSARKKTNRATQQVARRLSALVAEETTIPLKHTQAVRIAEALALDFGPPVKAAEAPSWEDALEKAPRGGETAASPVMDRPLRPEDLMTKPKVTEEELLEAVNDLVATSWNGVQAVVRSETLQKPLEARGLTVEEAQEALISFEVAERYRSEGWRVVALGEQVLPDLPQGWLLQGPPAKLPPRGRLLEVATTVEGLQRADRARWENREGPRNLLRQVEEDLLKPAPLWVATLLGSSPELVRLWPHKLPARGDDAPPAAAVERLLKSTLQQLQNFRKAALVQERQPLLSLMHLQWYLAGAEATEVTPEAARLRAALWRDLASWMAEELSLRLVVAEGAFEGALGSLHEALEAAGVQEEVIPL